MLLLITLPIVSFLVGIAIAFFANDVSPVIMANIALLSIGTLTADAHRKSSADGIVMILLAVAPGSFGVCLFECVSLYTSSYSKDIQTATFFLFMTLFFAMITLSVILNFMLMGKYKTEKGKFNILQMLNNYLATSNRFYEITILIVAVLFLGFNSIFFSENSNFFGAIYFILAAWAIYSAVRNHTKSDPADIKMAYNKVSNFYKYDEETFKKQSYQELANSIIKAKFEEGIKDNLHYEVEDRLYNIYQLVLHKDYIIYNWEKYKGSKVKLEGYVDYCNGNFSKLHVLPTTLSILGTAPISININGTTYESDNFFVPIYERKTIEKLNEVTLEKMEVCNQWVMNYETKVTVVANISLDSNKTISLINCTIEA